MGWVEKSWPRAAAAAWLACLLCVGPAGKVSAASTGPQRPADPGRITLAEALVRQGLTTAAEGGTNRRAADEARRLFGQAERLARDLTKADPACERCFVAQAAAVFHRWDLGLGGNPGDVAPTLDPALSRFPGNPRLAYMRGVTAARQGQHQEGCRFLQRALMLGLEDPGTETRARQLLASSQPVFLNSWFDHGNFYQSSESKWELFNPATFRKETLFQVTTEQEALIGQQAFAELQQRFGGPVSDGVTLDYLLTVVTRLSETLPPGGRRPDVTVVSSPEVNAVGPPGHVIVTTGMLSFVETETELAGVLAHELAHTLAHHGARRLIKEVQAKTVASIGLGALKPRDEMARLIAGVTAAIAVGLFLRAYDRSEEREADKYAAHILFNAGYNPTGLSSFFLRLFKSDPGGPPAFLRTHPAHADRADFLTDYLESFPLDREMFVDVTPAFESLKRAYGGSIAAPAPPAANASPEQSPGGLPGPERPNPALPPLQQPGPPPGALPPPPSPTALPTPAVPPPVGVSVLPPPTRASVSPMPALPVPVYPEPPPAVPTVPAAGVVPGSVGITGLWTTVDGSFAVRFEERGNSIQGVLEMLPSWLSPARAPAGTAVFTGTRGADGSIVGDFINLPLASLCRNLEPVFSACTLRFGVDAATLTMIRMEKQYLVPACRWSAEETPRTDEWIRGRRRP